MVKSMTFSWSRCHEKDLKNPMKNLWKFPYSRPMKYWVKWPRSHEIPMKMAFHGLFKGTEKPMNFKPKISWCQSSLVFNGLQQIMTHEYPVNMLKIHWPWKFSLNFHGLYMVFSWHMKVNCQLVFMGLLGICKHHENSLKTLWIWN